MLGKPHSDLLLLPDHRGLGVAALLHGLPAALSETLWEAPAGGPCDAELLVGSLLFKKKQQRGKKLVIIIGKELYFTLINKRD